MTGAATVPSTIRATYFIAVTVRAVAHIQSPKDGNKRHDTSASVSLGHTSQSCFFLSPSQHTKSLLLHGSGFPSLQRSASFTVPIVQPSMLRAAFLTYVFILPILFTSAIAGQLEFRAKKTVADYPQIFLGHHNDCRLVCNGTISRNI